MVTENPRTTRDALIIELLGDIGALNDEIKRLPVTLRGSLRESLELIANSVEEAESTSKALKIETELALKTISQVSIENLNRDTRRVIEDCFSKTINNEIKKTESIAINLQEALNKFPSYFGNQYRKLCYLSATITILVTILAGLGALMLYSQSKSWEQRSVGIFNAYQEQQKIILSLPKEMQDKFRK